MTMYEFLLSEIDYSVLMIQSTNNPIKKEYWKARKNIAEIVMTNLTTNQAKLVWFTKN